MDAHYVSVRTKRARAALAQPSKILPVVRFISAIQFREFEHNGTRYCEWFNDAKGFGFISRQNGEDVLCITLQSAPAFQELQEGQAVQFNVVRAQGMAGCRRAAALSHRRIPAESSNNARAGSNPALALFARLVRRFCPLARWIFSRHEACEVTTGA